MSEIYLRQTSPDTFDVQGSHSLEAHFTVDEAYVYANASEPHKCRLRIEGELVLGDGANLDGVFAGVTPRHAPHLARLQLDKRY